MLLCNMSSKQALIYNLKVWLTSAVLTPILMTLGMLLYNVNDYQEPAADYIGFTVSFILFGIGYTLPVFFLMLVTVVYIRKFNLTEQQHKLIILIVAELLISVAIFGLQLWTNNRLGWNTLTLWLPYTLVSGCSILSYNLKGLGNVSDKSSISNIL